MKKKTQKSAQSNQMSTIEVVSPNVDTANTANTANNQGGLSFEERELNCNDVYIPGSPISPNSPNSTDYNDDAIPPLLRSTSHSITSPVAAITETSINPTFQCSPAMATADGMFAPPISSSGSNDIVITSEQEDPQHQEPPKDPNINRVQLGTNYDTVALLNFFSLRESTPPSLSRST